LYNAPKINKEEQQKFMKRIEEYKKQKRPIVYINESGFSVDNPRLYGYSIKRKRCYGTHNYNAKGRMNIIGGV